MRTLIGFTLALLLLTAGCGPAPASPAPTATFLPTPTGTATPTPIPSATSTSTSTPEPAWYRPLDSSYRDLKYKYALVINPKAKEYPSLHDVQTKSFNYAYFPSSPAYVAYTATLTQEGRTFYELSSGNWVAGEDVQPAAPSVFSGILLTREIGFRFGWVLEATQSVNTAGAPVRAFSRYQVVHEEPAPGPKPGYLAIGADEWLPESSLALVDPRVPPDADPNYCRFVYANIVEQTLEVYENCKLVFATLISSGQDPRWTFPGWFAILYKVDFTTLLPLAGSTSTYYLEGVPYFMTYAGNWGFHGAYWHDSFGSPASHGCINLSPADASWLYTWARIGDRVVISTGK
jgi:lipoprotein-anchoring transpeptidase ErfK/SrfK